MAGRNGMILSKLDKVHLHRILAIFVNNTGILMKPGTIRYSVEEIRRRMSFGGDFAYTFGDFFKLVFVRHGIKRNERDPDTYDTIIYLDVQLDNTGTAKNDDKLRAARMKIVDETNRKIDSYVKEMGLATPLS